MAERTRETNGCWPRSSDVIAFRLGYLQATCDRMVASQQRHTEVATQILSLADTILAMMQDKQAASGPTVWRRLKEAYATFEKLHKLFTVVRAIRWGSLGWTVYGGFRWLGLM